MRLGWPARSSIDDARACPNCGSKAQGEESFCVACGAALAAEDESGRERSDETVAEHLPGPNGPPSPAAAAPTLGRRRLWPPLALLLGGALLLIFLFAVGGLAVLWHGERVKHHAASRQLDEANRQISELMETKARLSSELAAERELGTRRAAVLKRADKVLKGLEPLLTSVDELKSLTGEMQSQRDTFSSDSAILVDDLIALARYLLEPGVNDYDYVNSLIDEINSELSTVRYDQDLLTSSDGNYQTASNRFDARATALTTSVRALEKQLRAVTK